MHACRKGTPEFMQLLDRLTAENRQGTLSLSGEIVPFRQA